MNKVPATKLTIKKEVPIIGGEDKKMEEIAIKIAEERDGRLLKAIEPVISALNQNVDTIERRLSVVEETKQVFPSKVEVVVKKE